MIQYLKVDRVQQVNQSITTEQKYIRTLGRPNQLERQLASVTVTPPTPKQFFLGLLKNVYHHTTTAYNTTLTHNITQQQQQQSISSTRQRYFPSYLKPDYLLKPETLSLLFWNRRTWKRKLCFEHAILSSNRFLYSWYHKYTNSLVFTLPTFAITRGKGDKKSVKSFSFFHLPTYSSRLVSSLLMQVDGLSSLRRIASLYTHFYSCMNCWYMAMSPLHCFYFHYCQLPLIHIHVYIVNQNQTKPLSNSLGEREQ